MDGVEGGATLEGGAAVDGVEFEGGALEGAVSFVFVGAFVAPVKLEEDPFFVVSLGFFSFPFFSDILQDFHFINY
jgi:hypothetical protein